MILSIIRMCSCARYGLVEEGEAKDIIRMCWSASLSIEQCLDKLKERKHHVRREDVEQVYQDWAIDFARWCDTHDIHNDDAI